MKKAQVAGTQAGGSAGNAEDSIANGVHLADRINALHREVQEHETQIILKARAAGELLLEVKQSLKHGEYLAWLEHNFDGSQATAWRYMRIAGRWGAIAANHSRVNDLNISEALKRARYGYEKGRA